MPPGRLEDGILYVLMSGLAIDGVREVLHAVLADALGEPEARRLLLGLRFALNEPGGCRSLHALTAFVHTAGVTLTPYSKSFFAFGSGKSLTPCARMHSANFTALSRAVSFLALGGAALAVPVPVSEGASSHSPH